MLLDQSKVFDLVNHELLLAIIGSDAECNKLQTVKNKDEIF